MTALGPSTIGLNVDARHATLTQVTGDVHNTHQYFTQPQHDLRSLREKLQPAQMNGYGRPECHQGTRANAVDFITNWAFGSPRKHNVLWIYGLAGAGKSTLSTTVANKFDEMGVLGAFLFFDRDVAERSDPANVIKTTAFQIATSKPTIGEAVATSLHRHPRVCSAPSRLQFQRLLVEPLSSAVNDNQLEVSLPIIIILDALDECGNIKTRKDLLQSLAEQSSDLAANICFLIMSRPERDILQAFGARQNILQYELDITTEDNFKDISTYFRGGIEIIRNRTPHLRLDPKWPSDSALKQLTERASGLFVWASTALEFIDGYDPKKRIETLLQGHVISGAEGSLDALYRTALESIALWEDEDFVADFRSIMGLILIARQPITDTSIDNILRTAHRPCTYIISHLRCVLQQRPTVRLLHPSFAEFLLTSSRSRREIWTFDVVSQNSLVANHCLRHLQQSLKRNICCMTLSADLKSESLPEDISYACMYWIDHVCAVNDAVEALADRVTTFLRVHLLHWVEAMSIMRKGRETIPLLEKLLGWTKANLQQTDALQEIVHDSYKLSQTFARSIEDHPLLVYYTALPFAPTSSWIYQIFHSTDTLPVIKRGYSYSWSPLLLVLADHRKAVHAVSFSNDGTRILSGSDDGTIRLWNADSGAKLLQVRLEIGQKAKVLQFSSDDTRIASLCTCGRVHAWDASTGAKIPLAVSVPIESGSNSTFDASRLVRTKASSDNTCIADFDINGNLRMRGTDSCSGNPEKATNILASKPRDGPFSTWDNNLHNRSLFLTEPSPHASWGRRLWRPPILLSNHVFATTLDGTRTVWASNEGRLLDDIELRGRCASSRLLRIFDMQSADRSEVGALRGHEDEVTCVSFSKDGSRIVSGSLDMTIRVWDAEQFVQLIPPLRGHGGRITSVSFSPDGNRILSGSQDKTVCVWEAAVGMDKDVLSSMRAHDHAVASLTFARTGRRVISRSITGTQMMWDTATGDQIFDDISMFSLEQPKNDIVMNKGWLVHSPTGRVLLKPPQFLSGITCTASHRNVIVIGTRAGRVLILHIPPAVLSSPETRYVDGAVRGKKAAQTRTSASRSGAGYPMPR